MAKKKTTTTTVTTTVTVEGGATKEVYDAFVIDRSGSMATIWDSTIDGANEYLNKSKRTIKENGLKGYQSLIWFDDEFITQYNATSIDNVPALSKHEYGPRGSTALNDAVARMIRALQEKLGKRAGSDDVDVTITVFTDGYENASTEFPGVGNSALKALVKDVQDRLKWTVTYVGAGSQEQVRYFATNVGVSVSNVMNYTANDSAAVCTSFGDMAASRDLKTKAFASGLKSNINYFAPAKEDEEEDKNESNKGI